MNRNAEFDPGVLTPEAQRQAVVGTAVAKVEIALLATGYTVDQQPATPVTAAMQEAVQFTPEQNQVGNQDGLALAA